MGRSRTRLALTSISRQWNNSAKGSCFPLILRYENSGPMAGRQRAPLVVAGARADLAQALRRLRDDSGMTLRQVAARSGYAQTTLSMAESGRRVPSWEALAAFVQSCGDDAAEWQPLWEMAAHSGPVPASTSAPAPQRPQARVAQVPADASTFTGREAELAALDDLLVGSEGAAGPAAAVISAIAGTAG